MKIKLQRVYFIPESLERIFISPLKADHAVQMATSNGLVINIPMHVLDEMKNALNGNLHFMATVETAIYSNFPVFQK